MRFIGLFASLVLMSLTFACASGLPAVVSSTPEKVSIEFSVDSTVGEAGKLAETECMKVGKHAEYVKVDSTATARSRIANFHCVDSDTPPSAQ